MKDNELVKVVYNGMECYITKEEYEDLKKGYLTWKDLFE